MNIWALPIEGLQKAGAIYAVVFNSLNGKKTLYDETLDAVYEAREKFVDSAKADLLTPRPHNPVPTETK